MNDKPSGEATSKIGYRRPPEHSRFKPGVSGNPKGRPKQKGLDPAHILDVLNEPVPIKQKGRLRKMPAFEASIRKLLARAVKGDLNSALTFIQLCEKHKVIAPGAVKSAGRGPLIVPKSWDRDEWMRMLVRHGPPPWPGERSGLVETPDF